MDYQYTDGVESGTMCETHTELRDKVVIVTGGSSGIGLEAAKELAKLGAKVIIASRNETKLKHARDYIQNESGNSNIAIKILDHGSLKSVRQFTQEFNETRLDVLINHAGAVGLPDKLTADGLDLTMQVNFFGSFLLTFLLLPLLKSSAPSRIINDSAASMYIGQIDFEHWNDIGRPHITTFANSKLAITLFTAELSRRMVAEGSGVSANSYDPFVVRDTDVSNNVDGVLKNATQFFIDIVGQRKENAGKQITYLAAAQELAEVSGKVFKFCFLWWNHWLVKDKELTKKLWIEAKKAVQITTEEDWEMI